MKKLIIDNLEKNRILKIHGFLKEQQQPQRLTDEQKLRTALSSGCISKYKWFIPDQKPIRRTNSGIPIIYGKGAQTGSEFYFYADMTVVNQATGNKVKWECDFKPQTPQIPQKPTTLDTNQLKVLELIKPLSWFHEPKPTDVEVDQGIYQAMDLANPETQLGQLYSKYFKNNSPFFVYKKTVKQPTVPGLAEKIEINGETCKTSIRSLYNHMRNPTSVPLTNEQINSYVKIAQMCAEPTNRKIFRFGMNNELKQIANKYGINLQ